jgi:hypothetical protein
MRPWEKGGTPVGHGSGGGGGGVNGVRSPPARNLGDANGSKSSPARGKASPADGLGPLRTAVSAPLPRTPAAGRCRLTLSTPG